MTGSKGRQSACTTYTAYIYRLGIHAPVALVQVALRAVLGGHNVTRLPQGLHSVTSEIFEIIVWNISAVFC